jgi:hypothetical protein
MFLYSLFYSLDTDILKQECEMRNTICILGYLTVPSPHHGHIGLAASPTRKKHSEHAHFIVSSPIHIALGFWG